MAHGFAALTDMTITYLVDGYYNPADELGVAWDDPEIGADWGVTDPILSGRDAANPSGRRSPPRRAPLAAAHVTSARRRNLAFGAGPVAWQAYAALRHRRRRVHRLELRALGARQHATTRSSSSTRSPTPATSTTSGASTTTPASASCKGDICDRDAVRAAMDGHDAVRALRGREPRRPLDRRPRQPSCSTNCDGTNVICDIARQLGVERFLHISTDEVYGSIEEGSFVETDLLVPRSPYSASKAGSDLIALGYRTNLRAAGGASPGRRTTSGRTSSPRRSSRCSSPTCSTGRKVPLYGDGLNVRDWFYVEDNCRGVDLVLRRARSARSTTSAAATRSPTAS